MRNTTKRLTIALLGMALLLLVLAACDNTTSGATNQPTTPAIGAATATSADDAGTPIPTVRVSPSPTGPGAQGGVADICSQPVSVTVQPASDIPVYSGANLHISQVDPSNSSNVFYGFCTGAAVQDVFTFYQQQLPTKGWSNLKPYTVGSVMQVRATQGPSQITVSISPSAVLTNTTNIFVTVIGG